MFLRLCQAGLLFLSAVSANAQIVTNSPLPSGTVGDPYEIQFQYAEAPAGLPWSIIAGTLPDGLALDSGTGVLSGVPTGPGTYAFTVAAGTVNSESEEPSYAKDFSLTISPSASVVILTSSLPSGGLGQAYSQAVTATGGAPPYSYSGFGFPPGMAISSSGTIAGTPTSSGRYIVTVNVADANHGTASRNFNLTIVDSLTIFTSTLIKGSVGHSYFQPIQVAGGTTPYSFSATGLPAGIAITSSGILSGTPSQAGTFMVEVTVLDVPKHTAVMDYTLTIYSLPTISTTSPLPAGTVGAAYSQTLAATSGLAPYTFFVLPTTTVNPLPPGLTLNTSGLLSGTPTAAGTYLFSLQAIDANQNSGIKAFQLTIGAGNASISVSQSSLQFSAVSGADVPGDQNVTITSPTPATFTVQVDDGNGGAAPAWLKAAPSSGVTPGSVHVIVLPNTLGVGTYTGRVRVTSPGAAPANILVTFTVSAPSPALTSAPSILRFRELASSPQTQTQPFTLRNPGGGGPVPFTLSIAGNSSWLSAVASANSIRQNVPVVIKVTVNSQGLPVGSLRDAVRITTQLPAPYNQIDLPVSVNVAASGAAMSILTNGIRFATTQGNQTSPARAIAVRNTGDPGTTVNWTARVLRGASLVNLQNASGVSTPGSPSSFLISLSSTAANAAGGQFALIQVSDPQAQNAPQFVTVLADVAAAGTAPFPDPDPAGLVFVATSGITAPGTQQVTVNTTSAASVAFSASPSTDDGANWLSLTPGSGNTSQGSPAQIFVAVNPSSLSAGVYTGNVNIAIGSSVRSVNVTMVLKAAATLSTFETRAAASAVCSPTSVAFVETGLVNSFVVPAGWPATLSAQVLDNCGDSLSNANVVASFSNGDPPIALDGDQQSGYYAATWQPGVALPQMTVTLDAGSGVLLPAEVQLSGNVNPNAAPAPSLVTAGLLNNLNPVVGAPLAPGTIVQVYGDNLSPSPANPSSVPLPLIFNGVEAIIGGISAPLFYVSKNQLVVQLPSELAPNRTYATVLSANNQYTLPQNFDFVTEGPGTVAFSDGTLVAQHTNYTLVDSTHPAKPGESLTIYLVGMGATVPAVPSGSPAPTNPLAQVSPAKVLLTVDGQTAPISFAGLTPGGVGLYQINFTVPAGARTGSLNVVITEDGVAANATKLIVSQ